MSFFVVKIYVIWYNLYGRSIKNMGNKKVKLNYLFFCLFLVFIFIYRLIVTTKFLEYSESIKKDVLAKKTYVVNLKNILVGTATVDDNHICRLFVLPEYQGQGIGSALLDYLEDRIIKELLG